MMSPGEGVVDTVAARLRTYTNGILTIVFGILPLFFIPIVAAPFEYTKILFVLMGVTAALILFSLAALRSGTVSIGAPLALWALWGVVLVSLIASALSGDFHDSFVGDFFSTHSTAFVGVLALIMSVWIVSGIDKVSVMRTYMLLAVSTLVLVLFHVLRIIFGEGALSLGIFTSQVATPVGSWNDLALFLGLSILLALVALEQLPLTKWGRRLFAIVSAFALVMLAIINFFSVWIVLGLVSLVMLVYTLGKNRMTGGQTSLLTEKKTHTSSLTLSLAVFIVSTLFIIGGSALGGFINAHTDISYIEVRPSVQATLDIARGVYGEHALLGTGPNKFADAWRLHKDDEINRTVFWNVDFSSGFGYIPTFFVTTGVLGGLAWLVFLGLFVVTGVRFLVRTPEADRMWYFIASSSFLSAVYIWGMSLIHVPGAVMLMLGALCTGITFVAYNALRPEKSRTFTIGADRRTGFILSLVVIVVIVVSVSMLYVTGRHYAAAYTFTDSGLSVREGQTIDAVENKVLAAFQLSNSDLFARRIAEYQIARMQTLLNVAEPTDIQQQQFSEALTNAVTVGNQLVTLDATEPDNWATLGTVYSTLVAINVEGAYERAIETLTRARDLDAQNPARYLALAEVEARAGNMDAAKAYANDALGRKSNYSAAFAFLTQLALAEGDVDEAVASTQALVTFDPQNQARLYQLGVLEYARGSYEAAAAALARAVGIDADYANARYYLALAFDKLARPEDAKAQLEHVLTLNPDNVHVKELLAELEQGRTLDIGSPQTDPVVPEPVSVVEEGGAVTTTTEPDTDLIAPVNTAPAVETPEEDTPADTSPDTAATSSDDTSSETQ